MSSKSLRSPSTLSEGSEILETDTEDINSNYSSIKFKPTGSSKAIMEEPCMSSRSLASPSTLLEASEILETDTKDINKKKRPFSTYINDPLLMAIRNISVDLLIQDSSEAYAKFKEKVLTETRTNNSTNNNMRRVQSQSGNVDNTFYVEKRKKNNIAAKKSRDARKAKEEELATRCAFLEQENFHLKIRLDNLESEKRRLENIRED